MGRPSCSRARVADVAAWIDAWAAPLAPEELPLSEAARRVLAADVTAAVDQPPLDRAAADGFAVRADETLGAGAYNPLPFRLAPATAGVAAGRAVAVESGDPMPPGADAVVRLEQVAPDAPGTIAIIAPVAGGNEVEAVASHAERGSVLVAAGRRLGPGEIGLLASAGVARVSVAGRPRARCLLALEPAPVAGHGPGLNGIRDANGPMLTALVERDGGVVVEQRRSGRDRSALREALQDAGADVVLIAGGTGPGAGDEAAVALAEAGEVAIHGVALRPGETAGAGRTASGVAVLLLPGTPAACLWAYELIAGRAIRRLAGLSPALPFATRPMRLARKIVSEIGMTEIWPIRCAGPCNEDSEAEPLAPFAEAGLVAAAQGDGFIIVPEASEGYPQGASVTVHLYPGRGLTLRPAPAAQRQTGKPGV
jgi:molybdopterin molybdotransferase